MKKAKTMKLNLHVRDGFDCKVIDEDGGEVGKYYGYVPDCVPPFRCDDDFEIEIDIETGAITNWKPLTQDQVKAMLADSTY